MKKVVKISSEFPASSHSRRGKSLSEPRRLSQTNLPVKTSGSHLALTQGSETGYCHASTASPRPILSTTTTTTTSHPSAVPAPDLYMK
ncbi:hypothetical protein E2C01_065088 [Portunus trituberculatus]|uniref:Uncharacterized protein n=1 Tax=Portunus trituberculatus TaxID=210409 RepID=A0A5B7HQ53_PORTR|nr:hypothetical protein [Portunus trituberculatus]